MEPTTGLILRRITQTNLSVAAHKLATLILDAIAWKEECQEHRDEANQLAAEAAEEMSEAERELEVARLRLAPQRQSDGKGKGRGKSVINI